MGAAFCTAVATLGMLQRANVRWPGDNAHAESFCHSLKSEVTRGVVFPTAHALGTELRRYSQYYNRTRLHPSLNFTSSCASLLS